MSVAVKASLEKLLTGIVDYAGLFPPAQLSLPEAVLNYATYRNSNFSWMLGRFIVQIDLLDEFVAEAGEFFGASSELWRVSVIANEDFYETVRRVDNFNAVHAAHAVCDALEIKVWSAAEIEHVAGNLPHQVTAYFELPLDEKLADLVGALSLHKQRAKIRTGGVTAEAFPETEAIVRFVRTCLAANVPFKATAGLHHPLRCLRPLTYAENAPAGVMNGFLNLFLAAGFVREGFKAELIREILLEEDPAAFVFEDNGLWWRQEHFLGIKQIERLRESHAISFGSCSFTEPVEDLRELGLF
jgi:hypothetical protein